MSGLAFDNHLLLMIVCRFQEVSNFLNTQNTFEFDHPMSLMIFKKAVHPSLMKCIKSIWINLQRDLYNPGRPTQAFKFLRLDVWPECGTLSLEWRVWKSQRLAWVEREAIIGAFVERYQADESLRSRFSNSEWLQA
jgi:hypothetical protein